MATLKLSSMNAITRTLSPSHGLFYSFDSQAKQKTTPKDPLILQAVSLVGTLGSWKDGESAEKNKKSKKEQTVSSNIQTVDTCFLPPEHNAYCLRFNLRIASLVDDAISNNGEVLAHFRSFVTAYKEQVGGELLARRYLTNFINGRFLWRNKYASEKTIKITIDQLQHRFSIDLSFDFSSTFNDSKDQKKFDALVQRMAQALFDKEKVAVMYVSAVGTVGYGQEVYPSQEFVNDKQETKSKVLFDVLSRSVRVAAFHSQKLGNAIRTIDTWYEDDANDAIPVDPFGPDKKNQVLHRAGVSIKNNSIYSIFNRLLDPKKGVEPDSNDGHYLMACFIRGGVYAGK
jgi:CRISPR-associated protein Csy3